MTDLQKFPPEPSLIFRLFLNGPCTWLCLIMPWWMITREGKCQDFYSWTWGWTITFGHADDNDCWGQ